MHFSQNVSKITVAVISLIAIVSIPSTVLGQPLELRLQAEPSFGTAPLTVEFTAVIEESGDCDVLRVDWHFDDGTTENRTRTRSITHTYQSPGNYEPWIAVIARCQEDGDDVRKEGQAFGSVSVKKPCQMEFSSDLVRFPTGPIKQGETLTVEFEVSEIVGSWEFDARMTTGGNNVQIGSPEKSNSGRVSLEFLIESDANPGIRDVSFRVLARCSSNPSTIKRKTYQFELRVIGTPQINLGTSILNYGDVKIGTTQTESLQIENEGNSTLSISSITISEKKDVFELTAPRLPITLDTGESFKLDIGFNPKSEKSYQDKLKIESNDPNTSTVEVQLIGQGKTNSKSDTHNVKQKLRYVDSLKLFPKTVDWAGSIFGIPQR